jgi:hypothetical protein
MLLLIFSISRIVKITNAVALEVFNVGKGLNQIKLELSTTREVLARNTNAPQTSGLLHNCDELASLRKKCTIADAQIAELQKEVTALKHYVDDITNLKVKKIE